MDLINNLLYTALNETKDNSPFTGTYPAIPQEFVKFPITNSFPDEGTGLSSFYEVDVLEQFVAFDDPDFIDKAIQKHWADMVFGRQDYQKNATGGQPVTQFTTNDAKNIIPLYHLIYAYLVENTRVAQIFAKLVFLYLHDEKLQKASGLGNQRAFQWIVNTENLFFKTLANTSFRNITSQLRLYEDKSRRNAYFRMFAMDLAFGDMDTNQPVDFYKAEINNQSFIVLFEKFIAEIWQAYINARNATGPNSTDYFQITDTARLLGEMLMSRRTTEPNFNNYRYFNLSREEYASVVMMSWFYHAVVYDSPIVKFLNCNGNSPGERLVNIGNRVGLPAHSKSEALLDIAPPMNTLLRRIELKDYNDLEVVRKIVESQIPGSSPTESEKEALTDLLLIINNWEKATGHKIKNRESNIVGTVKVEQNGVKQKMAMN